MKSFGKLSVSVASNVGDDSMRVILHASDFPLIEGIVSGNRDSNERRVTFRTPEGERTYAFGETRDALRCFIEMMLATQNETYEDLKKR